MPVIGTPVTPLISVGYVNRTYMEIVRGEKNIRDWSNKDNVVDTADDDAINAAIETATAIINAKLGATYVLPLDLSEDADGAIVLRRWAEVLASYELVVARGIQDDNAAQADLSAQREQVMAEIDSYVADTQGIASAYFNFSRPDRPLPVAPLVVI